jgi:hypothetical protein
MHHAAARYAMLFVRSDFHSAVLEFALLAYEPRCRTEANADGSRVFRADACTRAVFRDDPCTPAAPGIPPRPLSPALTLRSGTQRVFLRRHHLPWLRSYHALAFECTCSG